MINRFVRSGLYLLVGGLVIGLATGCVIDRTRKSASYKMRADVDSARDRARDLEKDLVRERQRIDSMQNRASDARKRLAESGATLESFLEELMQVRGELSTATHASAEAGRFSEDLDMRISEIEVRFSRLEAALRKAELLDAESLQLPKTDEQATASKPDSVEEVQPTQRQGSSEQPDSEPDVVAGKAPEIKASQEEEAGAGPEEEAFQRALLLVQNKSWDRAGASLQEFLKTYPESRWQLEGLYLLGECLFKLERYRGALRQYQRVVDSDNDGKWAARSMLRQAQCFEAMEKPNESAVFLSDLVRLYPESPEAARAQEKMEESNDQ
jgi:tol-pal system protein YbgF